MRANKSGICDGGRLLRALARPAEAPNHRQIRDPDPMPNDPEALLEWGKRNIQGEPENWRRPALPRKLSK
jgi:hypothetical protein